LDTGHGRAGTRGGELTELKIPGIVLRSINGRETMADSKSDVGSPDRDRISLSEDYEVRDWTKSLGVSEERLREAVQAVGNSADAVREYLKR
jgi:hypothetical protein